MKFHWLLSGALGVWLLSSPVQAANLQFWRFDANRNRLEFTTSSRVQPRAQLIFNPTRLVIDLPGVRLGRSMQEQPVKTPGIRLVRVGQFTPGTTRIVIELIRGYTLDPQQVRFQGATLSQWLVQLPTPQPLNLSPPAPQAPPVYPPLEVEPFDPPLNPGTRPAPTMSAGSATRTTQRTSESDIPRSRIQVENLRVTTGGFFISTRGETPEIKKVERSKNGTEINIDLPGASIDPNLRQRELSIDSKGVKKVRLSQVETSPPVTRITLSVTEDSPNWRALPSGSAIILLPEGGSTASPSDGQTWPAGEQLASADPGSDQTATIQSVQLFGSRLIIRTDRPVNAMGRWETPAVYKLTISRARLSNQTRTPQLNSTGPLSHLSIEQSDINRVVISLRPVFGFTIKNFSQSGQYLSLPLSPTATRNPPVPPVTTPRGPIVIDVPPPNPSLSQPRPSPRNPGRRDNERLVVVVDPGHGGGDPGAIGIGGLQEKQVVLDISRQVATILQRQGIQALLTRFDDREIDLQPRVDFAERVNASLFVSIHANAISLSRPDVNGLETYYYDTGVRLARTIHDSILRRTGIPDRRVRRARFYVLRKTSMPAVLVETGFVTGADDAPRLRNPAYRRRMAEAIAEGIVRYLRQN
ncbi:MAG: N-acetylmuramoyl-L-alanine amidase [Hormoscilla sp. GM102CHS1]|nr:N-acetylmuramoyl-L-alanine amidase [Hormoscilla sp. GM102CHS1]